MNHQKIPPIPFEDWKFVTAGRAEPDSVATPGTSDGTPPPPIELTATEKLERKRKAAREYMKRRQKTLREQRQEQQQEQQQQEARQTAPPSDQPSA